MVLHDVAVVRCPCGIEKSFSDKREYGFVELDNKLVALLVSDPLTEKAGASMDVNVGHFSDPDEIPGLAHFLEHMLFLGTEKYPNENSYSSFLSENGGKSNAYTSMENTNYYFDVGYVALGGALDRFAQFFISPLFTASATDRELQAVDSEHSKNLQDDMWRCFQLEKTTSNPKHPYHKFATGSSKTLRDIPVEQKVDVRRALLDFHKRYYSANRMKLVVLGRESLQDLEAMVRKYFSAIVNTDVEPPSYGPDSVSPISENEMGRLLEVVPVKDLRTIEITWGAPSLLARYMEGPDRYVSNLVGHEGPGSILSFLKTMGWANELSAGLAFNTSTFSLFKVTVDCTLQGMDHVNEIIAVIYAYLNELRKDDFSGVQDWLWTEVAVQSANAFRFQSSSQPFSFVSRTSSKMHKYPINHVLSGGLLRDFNRDHIIDFLKLLTPERAQVMLVCKKSADKAVLSEKWYGTKYSIEKVNQALLEQWTHDPLSILEPTLREKVNLHLPARNEFLPTDFSIADFVQVQTVDMETVASSIQNVSPLLLDALESTSRILSVDFNAPFPMKVPATARRTKSSGSSTVVTDRMEVDTEEEEQSLQQQQQQQQGRRGALKKYIQRNALEPWVGTTPNGLDAEIDVWRPPVLIAAGDQVGGLLWFKQDTVFKRPKGAITCLIQSPVTYQDPKSAVLSELYALLAQDVLTEIAYAAEIAGLFYNFRTTTSGIVLTCGGFTHKLQRLLTYLVDALSRPEAFTNNVFQRFKDKLKQDYENFDKDQAYQHAIYTCNVLLNLPRWHVMEKLAVIHSLTLENLVAHVKLLLNTASLESLVSGNLTPTVAIEYASVIRGRLIKTKASHVNVLDAALVPRVVALEMQSESYYMIPGRDPDNTNSAVEIIYQIGPDTPMLKGSLQLLAQIAQEPCFNTLRTEQQLGYIVFCGVRSDQGICALRVIVQSTSTDPFIIDKKVEGFLDYLYELLTELDDVSLQQNIEAVLDYVLEKDKTIFTEVRRWANEIESHFYRFSRNVEIAATVSTITKSELLQFFEDYIHKDGRYRRKLCVGMFGSNHRHVLNVGPYIKSKDAQNPSRFAAESMVARNKPKVRHIDNIKQFRASNALFPVQSSFRAKV